MVCLILTRDVIRIYHKSCWRQLSYCGLHLRAVSEFGKKSDAVCGFLAYFCAVLRFSDPPYAPLKIVFSVVLTFITAPKIQIDSNFGGCYLKIIFLHIICQVFLAVLLCKILESWWVFKIVHRYNVLIFHSSSPGESVRALTVLIDVWHVNSGSPLSFPVCSKFNKIL